MVSGLWHSNSRKAEQRTYRHLNPGAPPLLDDRLVEVLYVASRFRGDRPFGVLREHGVVVVRPLDVTEAPQARLRGPGAPQDLAADGLLLLSARASRCGRGPRNRSP